MIDEIINGRRDCLLIATTDQPERFNAAIYRRFVEKGKVIEIADYWRNPENLKAIVQLELKRNDIRVGRPEEIVCHEDFACLPPDSLDAVVEKLFSIFEERTLKIIPAYVRKLIHSIIEIQDGFKPEHLEDPVLVRQAFELVAKNSFGDLYAKFVDRMDRSRARRAAAKPSWFVRG